MLKHFVGIKVIRFCPVLCEQCEIYILDVCSPTWKSKHNDIIYIFNGNKQALNNMSLTRDVPVCV